MATFTNRATLSYGTAVVASNIAVGNLVEVLTATKTATDTTYAVGDTITYAVSIFNSGTNPYTGLRVTDDLGGYAFGTDTLYPLEYVPDSLRYYVNGVPQTPGPALESDAPLTVTGITVPAGGNVMLLYEATVTDYAPPTENGSITNNAVVTGDGLNTPVTAANTVTATPEPTLTLTKTIDPATVTENSTVTYTFTIQNTGNAAAEANEGVVLGDTFDPALTNVTVTYNGAPADGTFYTYDEATGNFSTVAGQVTVPAATFRQNDANGTYETLPGITTVTVTGTI